MNKTSIFVGNSVPTNSLVNGGRSNWGGVFRRWTSFRLKRRLGRQLDAFVTIVKHHSSLSSLALPRSSEFYFPFNFGSANKFCKKMLLWQRNLNSFSNLTFDKTCFGKFHSLRTGQIFIGENGHSLKNKLSIYWALKSREPYWTTLLVCCIVHEDNSVVYFCSLSKVDSTGGGDIIIYLLLLKYTMIHLVTAVGLWLQCDQKEITKCL